jgi:hypothetical protein
MNHYTRWVGVVILALVCACTAFAQRDLATVAGTVTDPTGAVVVGATVAITNTDTSESFTITTNESGNYVRTALRPGTYMITVSAAGFRKAEQKGILLRAGERTGANIALVMGNLDETIEVKDIAPLLHTENAQVGQALGSQTVADLPLGATRTFAFLARLSVGVVPGESGSRDGLGGSFSANGVRAVGQTNYLLNGVDNNNNEIDFMSQTAFLVGPSPEAIDSMTVETTGYNAEYGRAAGAVVNVNIKSGTNNVHGILYDYLQNDALNSNRWDFNRVGFPRTKLVQNQFGFTFGGPIIKDKFFGFLDYQGTVTHGQGAQPAGVGTSGGGSSYTAGLGFAGLTTVPTAAMRTGDFSSILGAGGTSTDNAGNPVSFVKGMVYDPTSTVFSGNTPITRTPFTGNVIPQSRFDPVFYKIMQLYPLPNQRIITGAQPTNDYFYDTSGKQGIHQGDVRLDYRASAKDQLFGSVSWANTHKHSDPPFGPIGDGTGQIGTDEYDLTRNAQISYTRVWTPTLVSETRVGFSRLAAARRNPVSGTDEFKAFGIGGYNPTYVAQNNGGLPIFGIASYSPIGSGTWMPTVEYDNTWDVIQNVAMNRGAHALKVGAEFRQIKFPFLQVADPRGAINYAAAETAFPSAKSSSLGANIGSLTGDAMASALLGVIDNSAVSSVNWSNSERKAWAFYFQDDWKASPNLTVNLGLRYELWTPTGETWGGQSNFEFGNPTSTLYIPEGHNVNVALPPNFPTLYPNLVISRGKVDKYLIPWDKKDFGPRVGLAYKVTDKMVFRAGIGLFYGGEENEGSLPNRGNNPPNNATVTFSRNPGITSYVGISDPACTGCNWMPGGLPSGFPSEPLKAPVAVQFKGIQMDYLNPLVYKWNASIQRQLPWNLGVEVGYMGNHQAHQKSSGNTDTYANLGTTNTALTSETQRYVQPACPPPTCANVGTGMYMTTSNGFGNYHAMTARAEKRMSNGLQFTASYTWGHALSNTGSLLSGNNAPGNLRAPDQTDWSKSYSQAGWDIRQSFVAAFSYQLPFGKGQSIGHNMKGIEEVIAGGWAVNGILTLHTGQWFPFTGFGCQGVWAYCRPDYVSGYSGNLEPSGGRGPNQWFDTTALQTAAPLTGGNVGINTGQGPGVRNVDFSLFKNFHITERWQLQFRAEGVNLFNHPQFSLPDASLADSKAYGGNGLFGVITLCPFNTERHFDFALKLSF